LRNYKSRGLTAPGSSIEAGSLFRGMPFHERRLAHARKFAQVPLALQSLARANASELHPKNATHWRPPAAAARWTPPRTIIVGGLQNLFDGLFGVATVHTHYVSKHGQSRPYLAAR
jgi:hypothetical protein